MPRRFLVKKRMRRICIRFSYALRLTLLLVFILGFILRENQPLLELHIPPVSTEAKQKHNRLTSQLCSIKACTKSSPLIGPVHTDTGKFENGEN